MLKWTVKFGSLNFYFLLHLSFKSFMFILLMTFYCCISRVPPSNESFSSSMWFPFKLLNHFTSASKPRPPPPYINTAWSRDRESDPSGLLPTWTLLRTPSRCSFSSWAPVRRCGVTTSTNPSEVRPSWRRSRPNSAPCGLCRRKCSSRRFPSSWRAPVSGSLTPSSPRPGRAAPCCRTPTEGAFCLDSPCLWLVALVWPACFSLPLRQTLWIRLRGREEVG